MRTKKPQRGSRVLGFLVLFAVLGMLGFFIYQAIWGPAPPQFTRAVSGTIRHQTAVDIIFANREYPLQAAANGKVDFKGSDGERFRRGETVADIVPQGATPGASATGTVSTVRAPHGGLLYKTVDGLEALYTPDSFLNMDLAKLLAQQGKPQALQQVQAGQVFGKIVDNLSPSVAFVELPTLNGLVVGKSISLTIKGSRETAKILRKSENPLGVVVQFASFLDGSVQARQQKVEWDSRPATNGIVVPRKALWQEGGKEGIYVAMEGVVHFRAVRVLDENETMICIKDLPEGIQVVINPRTGLEGVAALKN